MAKLDPELREALATEPVKRSAFQEDLIRSNSKKLTVDPKAMQAAMTPADLKAWTDRNRPDGLARQGRPARPRHGQRHGRLDRARPQPVRLLRKGNFKNPGGEVAAGLPVGPRETAAARDHADRATARPAAARRWPSG